MSSAAGRRLDRSANRSRAIASSIARAIANRTTSTPIPKASFEALLLLVVVLEARARARSACMRARARAAQFAGAELEYSSALGMHATRVGCRLVCWIVAHASGPRAAAGLRIPRALARMPSVWCRTSRRHVASDVDGTSTAMHARTRAQACTKLAYVHQDNNPLQCCHACQACATAVRARRRGAPSVGIVVFGASIALAMHEPPPLPRAFPRSGLKRATLYLGRCTHTPGHV